KSSQAWHNSSIFDFSDLLILGGPAVAVTRLGCRGGDPAPAGDHPVQVQQQQGTAKGEQPTSHSPSCNTAASPQNPAAPAPNLGPGDSQQHGHKDPSGIFSRHDEFGDGSCYQAKNGPANN